MAICGSIITNLIATTSAALVGAAVVAVLPAAINKGLQTYASAAIFGATLGNFGMKKPKVAIIGLAIPVICKCIGTMQSWLIIVLSVVGTVAVARLFYTADKKKAAQ